MNKVNTRVVIHQPVNELTVLTETERETVNEKLKNRVNSGGFIVVESSATRSQFRNRQEGLRVLEGLILKALERKPERKNTRPSGSSIRRRLSSKKHRGMIKKSRGKIDRDSDS